MYWLYRARRGIGCGALLLLISLSARFAFCEEGSGKSNWNAPARAAGMHNPVAADDRSIAAGKSLYLKECASCHGESGRGNGPDAANLSRPPTDLCSAIVRQQRDGELFWKISEGRKPMPRFARTFKDEERWHVVNYIRSLGKTAN